MPALCSQKGERLRNDVQGHGFVHSLATRRRDPQNRGGLVFPKSTDCAHARSVSQLSSGGIPVGPGSCWWPFGRTDEGFDHIGWVFRTPNGWFPWASLYKFPVRTSRPAGGRPGRLPRSSRLSLTSPALRRRSLPTRVGEGNWGFWGIRNQKETFLGRGRGGLDPQQPMFQQS